MYVCVCVRLCVKRTQVDNLHVVWLQAEHAQTSPVQSPASSNLCPTPTPSAVGVYLGRLSVTATIASATAAASESANSPARGVGVGGGAGGGGGDGGGADGGGGGGSNTSPKARPRNGAPAAPERAGVKKDIELDDLVAYTKESTADWLEDVPSSDSENSDGSIYSDGDGIRLRPVPPFRDGVAAGAYAGATADAAAASPIATGPTAAATAAASISLGVAASPTASSPAERTGSCRADTTPVFIVRPLRVRGTLVIRERGAAAAQAVPRAQAAARSEAADGKDSPSGRGGSGVNGEGAGVFEPPPLVEVSLDVEAIALQVDVRQYAVLNAAVSALTMSHRRFKFRTMRPTTSVLSNPDAWWRYAIR